MQTSMICYSDMMKINYNNKRMDRVEKYIQDFTRGCSNELSAVEYSDGRKVTEYHEWLTPDNARSVAVITREEMIDKACEAFCKIICNGDPPRSTCESLGTCRSYDDFYKAMEE